jgi:hypothetical protein
VGTVLAWGGSGGGIDDVGFGDLNLNGDGGLMAREDELLHKVVLALPTGKRKGRTVDVETTAWSKMVGDAQGGESGRVVLVDRFGNEGKGLWKHS